MQLKSFFVMSCILGLWVKQKSHCLVTSVLLCYNVSNMSPMTKNSGISITLTLKTLETRCSLIKLTEKVNPRVISTGVESIMTQQIWIWLALLLEAHSLSAAAAIQLLLKYAMHVLTGAACSLSWSVIYMWLNAHIDTCSLTQIHLHKNIHACNGKHTRYRCPTSSLVFASALH